MNDKIESFIYGLIISILISTFIKLFKEPKKNIVKNKFDIINIQYKKTVLSYTIILFVRFFLPLLIFSLLIGILCRLISNYPFSLNFILDDILNFIIWFFIQFVFWGCAGAGYFYLISVPSTFNKFVFVTTGTIAVVILLPAGDIVVRLLNETLFKHVMLYDIYLYHLNGLLKFFLPPIIFGFCMGNIISYIFFGLSYEHFMHSLFHYRYLIVVVFFLFISIGVALESFSNSKSFFTQSLTFDNVKRLWLPYIITWVISFLVGTEMYEQVRKRTKLFKFYSDV